MTGVQTCALPICAKVASDAVSLEQARALLAHADSRTTDRIYRRKAERVSVKRSPIGLSATLPHVSAAHSSEDQFNKGSPIHSVAERGKTGDQRRKSLANDGEQCDLRQEPAQRGGRRKSHDIH